MKRIRTIALTLVLCLSAAVSLLADSADGYRKDYISKYSALAVSEMYRTGVPASITLAQGLLESGAGRSVLAREHNNHFGIKCHNWKGAKTYHDDDAKGECFRKYPDAEQSFVDHSDFLRYNDRYRSLFDLKTTDYKGWAYGLKKAGYATDPVYPKKLINLIEEYDLDHFDTRKKVVKGKVEHEASVPVSPSKLEQVKTVDPGTREVFQFSLSRKTYSQNGVPFIYAKDGETYSAIARDHNLFKREILRFNDLEEDETLAAGTVVYLQAKKNKAAKGLDKHVLKEGESLRDVAQRFAVKKSKLMKLNGIKSEEELLPGDLIKLRK